MVIEVSAALVVDGATVVIERPVNPVRVGARWARAWSWCQPRPSMTRSTTADASSTSSSKSGDGPGSGSSRPGTIWVTQPSFQSGSTGEALIGEEASERQHAGTDVPA